MGLGRKAGGRPLPAALHGCPGGSGAGGQAQLARPAGAEWGRRARLSLQKEEENRRLEEKRRAEEERQRLEEERRERELREAARREQRYREEPGGEAGPQR